MKRLYLLALLVMITIAAATPQGNNISILTVENRSWQWDVHIRLLGMRDGKYYYLTARGPEHPESVKFEVKKDIYFLAVYACGNKRTGSLNLMRNVRLVFPECTTHDTYREVPNAGEPTLEKVDLLSTQPQDGAVDERSLTTAEKLIKDGVPSEDINLKMYTYPYNAQIRWMLDWYNWANDLLDGYEPFS
jgi:hypothetical protein